MTLAVGGETPPKKRTVTNAELDEVKTFMVLNFGYDLQVCVPYADGAAIIARLEKAEKVKAPSYGSDKVKFLPEMVKVEYHVLNQREYREQKMLLLLGVDNE